MAKDTNKPDKGSPQEEPQPRDQPHQQPRDQRSTHAPEPDPNPRAGAGAEPGGMVSSIDPPPPQPKSQQPYRQGAPPALVETDAGVELSGRMKREQSRHAGKEPDPAPLRQKQARDDSSADPGPPQPPTADAGGPVPRVIHENERAPKGLKRFKIRAVNFGQQPTRYVLAADEEGARACYTRGTGLDAVVRMMRAEDPQAEGPMLYVKELPD